MWFIVSMTCLGPEIKDCGVVLAVPYWYLNEDLCKEEALQITKGMVAYMITEGDVVYLADGVCYKMESLDAYKKVPSNYDTY